MRIGQGFDVHPLVPGRKLVLGGVDIPYQVTDRNMSVLEGSIIAIQMRILVPDDHEAEARELLVDAELGNWLRP